MSENQKLSEQDWDRLALLESKSQIVRDRVQSVIHHYLTGLHLWGPGGTGKSYTVLNELEKSAVPYVLHSARMTGKGLVKALEKDPSEIHVIEDCESMLDDKLALGVLRSALGSQCRKRPPERPITWTAHKVNINFTFTGGIIIIANRKLEDIPELAAIATRIAVLHFSVSDEEIAALMRHLATQGFRYGTDKLTTEQCFEVCSFVINTSLGLSHRLDMRQYDNACKTYIQWRNGQCKNHWQDLVKASLLQRTAAPPLNRSQRIANETALAQQIAQSDVSTEEKLLQWQQQTGKSPRAFYRRLQGAVQTV